MGEQPWSPREPSPLQNPHFNKTLVVPQRPSSLPTTPEALGPLQDEPSSLGLAAGAPGSPGPVLALGAVNALFRPDLGPWLWPVCPGAAPTAPCGPHAVDGPTRSSGGQPCECHRAQREEASYQISVPNASDFAVFLKELAQIRKEEKEKKRRRLEDINTLKVMGFSTHAARQALHQASGNLDKALKVTCSEQPSLRAEALQCPLLR